MIYYKKNYIYYLEIPPLPLKRLQMEDFIKPKRRTFAEEMGVASKTTAKPLDVKAIKPQVTKLMEIKFDPRNEDAIRSRVQKDANVSDNE